ncbi:MAG: hypothetical protein Q9218_001486 [Villophora microphyllina]
MFDPQPVPHIPRGGSPRPDGSFSMPHRRAPWHPPQPAYLNPNGNMPGHGPRNTYTSTTRVWPSPTNQGTTHLEEYAPRIVIRSDSNHVDISPYRVMRALFEGVNQTPAPNGNPQGGAANAFPGLHQLFASVFNPANAAHGDAVYSQEALDRIISQFMDAHNGSSAPGPASAQAISALPKKSVTKEMLGSDGKAECSVCMDNVELGDEVTVLPCSHWFHGECVGAWLKEHDTCPHCRQGIMPKDPPAGGGEATQPRTPGQEPRNMQFPPLSPSAAYNNRNMMFRSQQTQSPTSFRSQMELPVPSRSRSERGSNRSERRRSSGSGSSGGRNAGEGSSSGGGISGAIGGWVSRHLGGGGSGSGDRSSG